ncbi:hypothetical protein DK37_14500 [Halomonas sp. SUBG004]|nr:hypothetical protein DK37_14500 [Halomonas sp. SUBG004]
MTAQEAQWLNHIIAAEELHVLFQPIVDANQQAIYGYEALIRGPKRLRFTLRCGYSMWRPRRDCWSSWTCFAGVLPYAALPSSTCRDCCFLNVMPLTIVERDFS